MRNTKVLSGLSLFSGAGGMDVGFIGAGIDVVGANDIDRDACLTYEANHPGRSIEQGDINSKTDYIKKFDGVDIVFGGPPCQGFSVAGKMNPADMRSQLLWSFVHAHLLSGKPSLPADAAPSRLRRLTVDEALRIQSFPDNYEFVGKQSSVLKQIGNAVPCGLAKVVAEVVKDCLVSEKVTSLQSSRVKRLHLAV
jgi:site-specific DNA-cytosine methylase